MAKSINVSGRMSVGRFEDEFQKTFGVRCNVKLSKWRNADNKATLASIRPKDFDAPKKVNLPIVGNMTVRTLKERFEANFGVMIELYVGRRMAPDNVTISAIREGRVDLSKKEKVEKVVEEVELIETNDDSNDSHPLSDEQIKEFKDLEENAEDSYDYRSLGNDLAESGELDWAKKTYQKAEKLAEEYDDYKQLAESLSDSNYLNDKSWAKKLYEIAEDLAEDTYDTRSLAESLSDSNYLNDKSWAKVLYKKSEELSEDANDYKDLAESVGNKKYLNDHKYAKEMYEKSVELSEEDFYCGDYIYLAESIANEESLGDKSWAKEIYEKAESLAESYSDYQSLSESLANKSFLGDYEDAQRLLKKAEENCENIDDIRNLAESLCRSEYFNENEKILKLYNKAESMCLDDQEPNNMINLAQSVWWNLKDQNYGKKLFTKAEKLLSHPFDYIEAARTAINEDYLNDKNHGIKLMNNVESNFDNNPKYLRGIADIYARDISDHEKARSLFEKCENFIETWELEGVSESHWDESRIKQYIYLAYDIYQEDGLNDRKYAESVFIKAEGLVAKGWDSSELAGYLEDFGEQEWSENVRNGNYSTKGSINLKNEKSISDTTLIKIEINDEEQNRAYNVIDVIMDKSIDTSNFNADRYNEIITDEEFLKKAKKAIKSADGWKYGYYMDGQETSLKEVIEYVSWGESIQIRLISVGDKELSFLSVDNFSDDGKEEFLKGTSFEAKEGDDDFEDFYNECVGSDNLLSFDYVVNYEG